MVSINFSSRTAKGLLKIQNNNLALTLYGLSPEYTYNLSLYATDSAGNQGGSLSDRQKFTTNDTTQPLSLSITLQELTPNRITLRTPASRDTRPQDSTPHSNIAAYHIQKIQFKNSERGIPADTLNLRFVPNTKFDTLSQNQTLLTYKPDSQLGNMYISFYFLLQDSYHHISVYSEDSSGNRSRLDTLSVGTRLDTLVKCPSGYSGVTRKSSDSTSLTSFCIQTLEYQYPDKSFALSIDAPNADSLCQASGANLCTEEQWKTSCMGDSENRHPYGISALPSDPRLKRIRAESTLVIKGCNQGAGDFQMATNATLRPLLCSTHEGVRDQTGQLAEWVRLSSSLGATPRYAIKGGHYLKPEISTSAVIARGQCTYEWTPLAQRPAYEQKCLKTGSADAMLVLRYTSGSGRDSLICKNYAPKKIVSYKVSLDSNQVIVTLRDSSSSLRDSIEIRKNRTAASVKAVQLADSVALVVAIIKGKANPSFAGLSGLKENQDYFLDTLSYAPFKRIKPKELVMGKISTHPLLLEEFNSMYWHVLPLEVLSGELVKQKNGSNSIGKSPKPFYHHPSISFRCCRSPL